MDDGVSCESILEDNYISRETHQLITSNRCGIPIVGLSAYSGSGKTTFLEKLIPELKTRGYRVAVLKHDAHAIEIDHPGKDSYRITAAGADMVIVSSSGKTFRIENNPMPVMTLLNDIHDVDLILLEGYKHEPFQRMLLYRTAAGQPVAFDPSRDAPLCIISDRKEWPGTEAPVFDLNDMKGVADFLSEKLIHP